MTPLLQRETTANCLDRLGVGGGGELECEYIGKQGLLQNQAGEKAEQHVEMFVFYFIRDPQQNFKHTGPKEMMFFAFSFVRHDSGSAV